MRDFMGRFNAGLNLALSKDVPEGWREFDERRGRYQATAKTWVSKCVGGITYFWAKSENPDMRTLLAYDAADLFDKLIMYADDLVHVLDPHDEYQVPEALAAVKKLQRRLRAIEVSQKLENMEGRTEEEAAAFRAKADQLRGS